MAWHLVNPVLLETVRIPPRADFPFPVLLVYPKSACQRQWRCDWEVEGPLFVLLVSAQVGKGQRLLVAVLAMAPTKVLQAFEL